MNATEMRKLTIEADRLYQAELRAKEAEAKLRRQETGVRHDPWWKSEGIQQVRDRIRRAATRGDRFHKERLSGWHGECPEFVVDYLKELGFEVDVTGGGGDLPQVLTIRWMADEVVI
jgi:hypothetical protein